jgi:3-dehydroquinate synthase
MPLQTPRELQIDQRVSVALRYPVHFTRDAFAPSSDLLADLMSCPGRVPRVLVVMDSGLRDAFPALPARIGAWFAARRDRLELVRDVAVVPGGEAIKNDYREVMALVDQMLEYRLCRHSFVLVLGGGAVLDAVGFATAIVHRGLRLLRMPSTTLAMDDAGIGVKNGMNLHGGKNTIGTFAAPFAVVNDFDLLDGLAPADWIGGVSEAFKVAMIKDAAFFDELCALAPALGRRDRAALERVIVRCAELHLHHIATSGDAFELGSARPLDFGHWAAHKLESLSNYRIGHGHAVAIGIALDALLAERLGWIDTATSERLQRALLDCGFTFDVPELRQRLGDGRLALLQGLEEFREHLGGRLCLALPKGLGALAEVHEVNPAWIEEHIARLLGASRPA